MKKTINLYIATIITLSLATISVNGMQKTSLLNADKTPNNANLQQDFKSITQNNPTASNNKDLLPKRNSHSTATSYHRNTALSKYGSC